MLRARPSPRPWRSSTSSYINSTPIFLSVVFADFSTDDVPARKFRATRLTERILTKLITDEILHLVYRAQEQLGCEGCEQNWASQWDHACLFFGLNPVCRMEHFVPEYIDEAMQSLDTNRVLSTFQAVAALLGAESFIGDEVDSRTELNTMIVDILNDWRAVPEDVSISFYSPLFDKTSELIQHVVESM